MSRSVTLVYALLLTYISASHGWEVKTISNADGNESIKTLLEKFSTVISERCNFSSDIPVYVPLSDDDLMSWMEQKDVDEFSRQYLLLKPEYRIDKNIIIHVKSKFCGLNDWLVSGVSALIGSLSLIELNEASAEFLFSGGSGLQTELAGSGENSSCSSVALSFSDAFEQSCQTKSLTRVSFSASDKAAPVLWLRGNSEIRHLELYQDSNPSSQGLILVGCYGFSDCNSVDYISLTLKDTIIDDHQGYSSYLIKINDIDELYADNATFNFNHKEGSFSQALYLYWTGNIQINNSYLNNFGHQGAAVLWDGVIYLHKTAYISNTVIRSSKGSDITGLKLTGAPYHNVKSKYLPRFSGITFESYISTGFDFDDKFEIYPEGNTGNIWNSNGVRCKGSDDNCALVFGNGTASTLPTTAIASITPASTATTVPTNTTASDTTAVQATVTVSTEEAQSGAHHSIYNPAILITCFGALFALYNLL